ncbi:MAG TPA: T9SS type A sorting domain-containing protein, partial [Flavobacteriales bacterium]|nr:T9SS type A sorting domain-containing protein [Flavobacteriales bacterium]
CNDGCPNDPLKTAAGICGCGVTDTDTDSDGTADCIDGCPNDPNKVTAGVCGCGVADVDADGDGVYTCQGDLCDNDPLKTTPGICGCGVADTDTDSDGTADCNDGCPNDPNKVAAGVCGCGVADVDADSDGVYTCQGDLCDNDPLKTTPGVCGCGVPDTDTDSDGTADCVDGCPNDPNKVAAGQCGCGNPDTDTDGDGTADCNDACPEDPYKIVPGICGCDTPDDDTDSDGLADCIDPCPESPTNDDTDADGTADCFDNCPLDPAKVNPSACGCGNPDIDSDGDTYMDCLDGCPSDPNKIGPGTCGCGVPEIDTDGDGLKDCVDQCPLVVGQPGSPCDDGDPSTENDVLNLSCACTGTPAEQPTTLELTTDNDGSATSWEIVPLGGGPAVCSGSGYPSNSTQTIPCALPDGCWSLRVHDAAMDGMCCMNGIGGYVLRAPNGGRIIDAEDAGIFGATAMENLGFCLPMGNDQLTPSRCDREDYMPSDFIQAVPNPAVQAQYGVGSQTDDGYQFWFFKPNGGYSRRVFITHANSSYIFPSGPDRCSYFRLNSLSTFPLPLNTLLNVRVRSVVNGVYSDFGPACRLKIDTETNCPTTLLVATPGPNMSCGLTGVLLNGSTTLHAVPVSGATRYLFEFSKPGYVRNITSSTSSLVITKWSTWPLEYGNTYNVRVKVSFDNGASYCLFGSSCTMSTASGPQGMAQEPETRGMVEPQASSVLNFWPNPNVTGQLTIELSDVGNGAHTGQVEIISMLGTTVQSEGLNFDGDKLNTVLQLDRRVAPGSYLVRVIVDHRNWTERLVIQ